jgi:hypothetical protein
MSIDKSRLILIAIFVGGLCVQVLIVALAFSEAVINDDDFQTLLVAILSIYAVHFGVIGGGVFAQTSDGVRSTARSRVGTVPFAIAVALASLWTLILVSRLGVFALAVYDETREDSVSAVKSYMETVSSASSFLVAGSLAFFFGKRS